MAITDTWLKSNNGKPREKVEVFTDRDALSVRASPKGKLVFQLRYRFNGKQKRLDLGSYPHISLKQAREETQKLKGDLERGMDPQQVKLSQKLHHSNRYTLQQLIDVWYEKEGVMKTSGKPAYRNVSVYLLPKLGKQVHDDIEVNTFLNELEEIKKKVPYIAVNILQTIKNAERFGVRRELIEKFTLQNISAKIDLNIAKNKTSRNLTAQEIYWVFWATMLSSNLHPKGRSLVLLSLFFGCRIGELRLCKKSDFDFDQHTWVVPPENHKTGASGKKIVRPLIPEIGKYLEHVFSLSGNKQYAFGLLGAEKDDRPMTISAHLSITNRLIVAINKMFDVDMEHWSMHDLRRTMRTHMSEFAQPFLCEIMLGHSLPVIWGTYDHYSYLTEQSDAYRKWFDRLKEIVSNHEAYGINGGKPSLKPDAFSHFAISIFE